jgi:hypothetical protein
MSSSGEPRPSKKRTGRKRLPAMPPGPSIQFVVVNHPDEFRAGDTMRNVRSHVMYKHREHRGSSPSERRKSREGSGTPGRATRTPSPGTTSPDGMLKDSNFLAPSSAAHPGAAWNEQFYNYTSHPTVDPMRTLAARIISAMIVASPSSAPPAFDAASEYPFVGHTVLDHDSMESLKQEYINNTDFFCHGMLQPGCFMQPHLPLCRPSLDALRLQQPPVVPQSCQRRVCLSGPGRRTLVRQPAHRSREVKRRERDQRLPGYR